MIEWEVLKIDREKRGFITQTNKFIKVQGHFELGSNVFAMFSDSKKIYLVAKEDEDTLKRIEIEWFFNKEGGNDDRIF